VDQLHFLTAALELDVSSQATGHPQEVPAVGRLIDGERQPQIEVERGRDLHRQHPDDGQAHLSEIDLPAQDVRIGPEAR